MSFCTRALLVVTLAAAVGCLPSNTPGTSGPPRIDSFTANPAAVAAGANTTLSWIVSENTDTLSLDQRIGDVSGKTNYQVTGLTADTTFTLRATNALGSVTATVTVSVASASVSSLSATLPATASAGTPVTLVVKALGAGGVIATGFRGTIHLASTDAAATLPADYTFTSGDAGAHSFPVTLATAGSQTVSVTSGALSATSGACLVSAASGGGAATTCALSNLPATVASGTAFTAHVKLLTATGATATGYTGTLAYTSTDGAATLPASSAFGAGDAGQRDVTVTLRTAGAQSLTATDGSITCTASSTVTATGPALAKFAFSGLAATATAGTAVTFTVTAQDSGGATLGGYRGQVSFSSTDAAAQLPAAYSFTAGDAGAHLFSATFGTAGSQTLTVADGSVTKTSAAVTVSAAAAGTQLVYTDPAAGGKVRLVKNAASTSTVAVLDLVAGAALTGYSAALNLPLSATRVTLDATPIAKGAALNPGSAPAAMAAALPSTGPLASVLVAALSQKAGGTGAVTTDASLTAGQVIWTVKLDLKAGALAGTVFDGATPGALFRGSLRNKLGAEQAGTADFAIGKLEVR